MSWKIVVLTGFVILGGAIIVASWKPWASGGAGGGTKITSYATCIKNEQQTTNFGPSTQAEMCRALGWTP